MKRKQLSKSEIRDLNSKILDYKVEFDKKEKIEILSDSGFTYYLKNSEIIFFVYEDKIIPTLKAIDSLGVVLPMALIDLPAVKFISSGADVMRPGIVHFDEFNCGDVVLVCDEKHKKKIAICIANDNSQNLKESKNGKSLKNIHYVTDNIWNFEI